MKIMMINPGLPVFLRIPSIPLGLVSIASYLQQFGHEVIIIDRAVTNINYKSELERFCPEIVGITSLSYSQSKDALKITEYIHNHFNDVPVVWGGQAASSMPEFYLREGNMDYLILGEGEITWKEFIDEWAGNRQFERIKGLAYLEDDSFICTPMRPVADLSTFPNLNWTLVSPEKYFSSFFHCNKMLYLHASKGCTAACTFCSNKQFHQGLNRSRNVDHIMNDLEYFVKKCGANGIYFSDELFLPKRSIRDELLDRIIKSGLDFVWGCQTRLGVLNNDDLTKMYNAGCRWILFGIESGDSEIIKKIKKGTDINLAKPTIDFCVQLGITVQASFIIGFPGETQQQIRKTVELAKQVSAALPALNILTVVPNSEIYYELVQNYPDFKQPKNFHDLIQYEKTMLDNPKDNFSQVSNTELKVLHYYYQWFDFARKDSVAGDSYGVIKKLAQDAINRIFKHGLFGFFYGSIHSAKQFLYVFFYSHFFPSILRKYGL